MAFTVTATPGGAQFSRGVDLLVRVLTNATETGGASTGGRNTAAGTPGGSLTPNFSSSFVAFAIAADGASTMSAAAASNTYDFTPGTHTDTWVSAHGHYTGTVTSGTPLTFGAGSTPASADHENWAAYEIPASGGTITVDGSSPAGVFGDILTSATTASFSPPAGAVLVAMAAAGGTGVAGALTCTITDTSGLGMTWTQRVVSSTNDGFQPCFVFTATVPTAAPDKAMGNPPLPWPPALTRAFGPGTPFATIPPLSLDAAPAAVVNAGAAAVSAVAGQPKFPLYIAGTGGGTGNAGCFVDQNGNPRLYMGDVPWGLLANAGRWGGTWQSDIDNYMASRAAQGFTAARCHLFGVTKTGAPNDTGDTWDGVNPFNTANDPTSGFNNTFWQRVDYLFNSAFSNGITVEAVAAFRWDFDTSIFASTWTTTQCTNYGTALGNRYKNQPNLMWFFGDDYGGQYDTQFTAILSAMQTAGDSHAVSIEYYATGTTSREDLSGSPTAAQFSWGGSHANYNMVYYYYPTFFGIEFAYQETTNPIPVFWGDGYYYGDSGGGSGDDRVERNMVWWALASGARGCSTGSDAIQLWPSTAPAAVTTENYFQNVAGKIHTFIESLTGWQNLAPDLSSTLVTAGRGTRTAYSNQFYTGSTTPHSNYVCCARTSDKSLALIYCGESMSITIDQTQIATGYTATWVDPSNPTLTQSATTGSTYSSSGLGNNAAGDPDWVLLLQGPPAVTTPAVPAQVSVVAPQPSTAVTVNAGAAAVAAAAPAASAADAATAGIPTVLAAAPAPVGATTVTAGVGAALVADPGATASTSSNTNAPAGVATVMTLAPAASVSDTATAGAPAVLAGARAPAGATTATAGASAVVTTAPAPAPAAAALPPAAVINAADPGATASTGSGATVSAQPAAIQAAAASAAVDEGARAGAAAVPAVAPGAVVNTSSSTNAPAGAAAVQAAAPLPSLALAGTATAQAALVLAAAPPPVPPLQQATSTPSVTDERDGVPGVTAAATSIPGVR